jgi:hypothetical protein
MLVGIASAFSNQLVTKVLRDISCRLSRGCATPAWWYTKAPYGYERKDASLPFVYLAF